jgi:hypothetical protein
MPSAPFALILKVSDAYLPSVHLLINGMSAMSTGWKNSVQAEREQRVAGVSPKVGLHILRDRAFK